MGPDDAGSSAYRTRHSDVVRVNLVLPPPPPPAAYSVAVPRTAVPVTVTSSVISATALPVTRAMVSMREPAPTVSISSLSGPMPAPVIQPVFLASAPQPTVSVADDLWDWGESGANAGPALNTVLVDRPGPRISAVAPGTASYLPKNRTDWAPVGGSRNDRDKAGNRGGGDCSGTSRPRITVVSSG